MALNHIAWMDILETGVPEIDDDHRSIINDFNMIGDRFNFGDSRDHLLALLHKMATKVMQHFSAEEELLRRRCFPRLDVHI